MFLVRIRCNDHVVNRVWVDSLPSARRVAWQLQNRLAWEGLITEAWIVEVGEGDARGSEHRVLPTSAAPPPSS